MCGLKNSYFGLKNRCLLIQVGGSSTGGGNVSTSTWWSDDVRRSTTVVLYVLYTAVLCTVYGYMGIKKSESILKISVRHILEVVYRWYGAYLSIIVKTSDKEELSRIVLIA